MADEFVAEVRFGRVVRPPSMPHVLRRVKAFEGEASQEGAGVHHAGDGAYGKAGGGGEHRGDIRQLRHDAPRKPEPRGTLVVLGARVVGVQGGEGVEDGRPRRGFRRAVPHARRGGARGDGRCQGREVRAASLVGGVVEALERRGDLGCPRPVARLPSLFLSPFSHRVVGRQLGPIAQHVAGVDVGEGGRNRGRRGGRDWRRGGARARRGALGGRPRPRPAPDTLAGAVSVLGGPRPPQRPERKPDALTGIRACRLWRPPRPGRARHRSPACRAGAGEAHEGWAPRRVSQCPLPAPGTRRRRPPPFHAAPAVPAPRVGAGAAQARGWTEQAGGRHGGGGPGAVGGASRWVGGRRMRVVGGRSGACAGTRRPAPRRQRRHPPPCLVP